MIKLLIVDDSALMRRQLMVMFQAEDDFDIRQARNGKEAVDENREFQPDVITLDINLPEMDGNSNANASLWPRSITRIKSKASSNSRSTSLVTCFFKSTS